MFQTLTLRGTRGAILRGGYVSAATVTAWTVSRRLDEVQRAYTWRLSAHLGAEVNRFHLRQSGLLFTAPRAGGFWCWPVRAVHLGESFLTADLGPPEQ